jgi:hypothetical protein
MVHCRANDTFYASKFHAIDIHSQTQLGPITVSARAVTVDELATISNTNVEPQAVYQLADGRLVLSRECESSASGGSTSGTLDIVTGGSNRL